MKITCQACHSKYNVADEKVQGKIVKIRCRKCGATIVVHGNVPASAAVSAPSEAPPASRITAPDQGQQQWHVSLSDTDQRTMTLTELVSLYQAGVATQETFVWTDGMPDWKPLSEVEAIVVAVNSGTQGDGSAIAMASVPPPAGGARDEAPAAAAEQAPVAYRQPEATPVAYRQPEAAAPVAYRQPEAPAPVAYRQPEAETAAPVPYRQTEPTAPIAYRQPEAPPAAYRQPEVAAPVAAPRSTGLPAESDVSASQGVEPRRASLVKRENRGRDLFGEAHDSSRAAEDIPAPQQYPAPYAAEIAKPTGQRNENSVLFSLAMLTKTGEERAPQPAPAATRDDSGMIDLKALAEKAASMRPAADGLMRAPALSTKAEVYIPPLAVSPNFGSYMGVNPARPAKNRTLAFIGAGVGVVALVIFGVFLGTQLGASTAAPGIASAAASAEAPDAGAASAAAAPSASDSAGEAAASVTPSATPSASAAKAAAGWHPPPGGWHAQPAGGAAGAGAGKAAGGGGTAAPGGATTGAAASGASAPPPPKKTSDCGCNGDLMCLMKCSASGH